MDSKLVLSFLTPCSEAVISVISLAIIGDLNTFCINTIFKFIHSSSLLSFPDGLVGRRCHSHRLQLPIEGTLHQANSRDVTAGSVKVCWFLSFLHIPMLLLSVGPV